MAIWWRMRYLSRVGFQQDVSRLLRLIEKGAVSDGEFNELALHLFELQREHNAAYRMLCKAHQTVRSWEEILAVPAAAFKELELTSIPPQERIKEFRSSGTTGQKPSRHFHSAESLRVYEASLGGPLKGHFLKENLMLVSLTPSREDAPHSSLVHMFGTVNPRFVGRADWSVDVEKVRLLTSAATKAIGLMGTAFNFVQFIDEVGTMELPAGSRVLETGGYKGRSREVSRKELHGMIRNAFGVSDIVTEYGMCELSSQAYAHQDGIFRFPPWARAQIVSPENGREVEEGETGLVRVFDLANVWSVLAVQTEDLGVRRGHGFELIGRASGAEARGCSLMSR
jgi:acyl-protein synthetase LuxE